MNFIIHCKLHCSQPFWPILLPMIYKELQIMFQLLVMSAYLFVDETLLIILSQFLIFCLTFLLTLLQTVVSYSISHFLATYTTSILSLNSLANLFIDIPFVFATKYAILNNLLHTTKIASFPTTNGNFLIKSTIRYIRVKNSRLDLFSFLIFIFIYLSYFRLKVGFYYDITCYSHSHMITYHTEGCRRFWNNNIIWYIY